MDVQMPEIDGLTATKIIRTLADPVGQIPIIAMTGNVLPHQVRSFLDAGMNDHVGKPIDRTELYKTVRNWLPIDAPQYTSPQKDADQAVTLERFPVT
jgi:CheY-like chemotaxis protein